MRAPRRTTVAACVVVAAALVYAGHSTRSAAAPARGTGDSVPAAPPAKASYARIGIGACASSEEPAKPAEPTPPEHSCSVPSREMDLASLSVQVDESQQ
jgi:hypothetical protein